jgi:hypothetical protein
MAVNAKSVSFCVDPLLIVSPFFETYSCSCGLQRAGWRDATLCGVGSGRSRAGRGILTGRPTIAKRNLGADAGALLGGARRAAATQTIGARDDAANASQQ